MVALPLLPGLNIFSRWELIFLNYLNIFFLVSTSTSKTAMLAWKWLDANVSCFQAEPNGNIKYVALPDVPLDFFLESESSEMITVGQIFLHLYNLQPGAQQYTICASHTQPDVGGKKQLMDMILQDLSRMLWRHHNSHDTSQYVWVLTNDSSHYKMFACTQYSWVGLHTSLHLVFHLHLNYAPRSFRQTDIWTPGKIFKTVCVVVPTTIGVSRITFCYDDTYAHTQALYRLTFYSLYVTFEIAMTTTSTQANGWEANNEEYWQMLVCSQVRLLFVDWIKRSKTENVFLKRFTVACCLICRHSRQHKRLPNT